MSSKTLLRFVLIALLLAGAPFSSIAQTTDLDEGFCAYVPEESAFGGMTAMGTTSLPRLGPYGTHRALVVLVKFKDDTSTGGQFTGWPLSATQAPSFAHDLFDTSANPANFSNSSVTRYFYDQSVSASNPNDALIIYGDVYPQVIETQQNEAAYYRVDINNCGSTSCASQNGGNGYLTKEVLDRIDAAGWDFSQYDQNNDGKLDYIYILIRRPEKADSIRWIPSCQNNTHPLCPSQDFGSDRKLPTHTAVSSLNGSSGTIVDTRWAGSMPPLTYDGKNVDWSLGTVHYVRTPFNVKPYLAKVAAHEIGHDVWSDLFISHLRTVGSDVRPWI